MKRLPLLISVPHAGLAIPSEVAAFNRLSMEEIRQDSDEGAAEIFACLQNQVEHFLTTDIARAFVDLNRSEDDTSKDGVVKTHTCWEVTVYSQPLSDELAETLLARYHRSYHQRLSAAATADVALAVDCHTMAVSGPPVGPDPGVKRPLVCLGNVHGKSCPDAWLEYLGECFRQEFGDDVALNEPFAGGYITRHHGTEMPWVQLELSRDPVLGMREKGEKVLRALQKFTRSIGLEK